MRRTSGVTSICVGLLVALGACGGDDVTAPPAFQLTFQGDLSFQGPHAGHSIAVAVVQASDGVVMAQQTGTVSGTVDPAFSFTFAGVLVTGVAYQVHYWIDSNFSGGTVGVCDPKAIDHQWNVAIAAVAGDVTILEAHNAANTVDVCTTFAAP